MGDWFFMNGARRYRVINMEVSKPVQNISRRGAIEVEVDEGARRGFHAGWPLDVILPLTLEVLIYLARGCLGSELAMAQGWERYNAQPAAGKDLCGTTLVRLYSGEVMYYVARNLRPVVVEITGAKQYSIEFALRSRCCTLKADSIATFTAALQEYGDIKFKDAYAFYHEIFGEYTENRQTLTNVTTRQA